MSRKLTQKEGGQQTTTPQNGGIEVRINARAMTNSDQTEKGSQIQIVVLLIIIAKKNINLKGGFSLHICHTWQLLNLSFCYSFFFLNTFLGAARQSNSRANVVYNFIRLFLNHPVLLYFRVISPILVCLGDDTTL